MLSLSIADLLCSLLNMNALTERSPRRRRRVRHHKSIYHHVKSKCYKVQNIIIISILIWLVVSIYFVGSLRGGGYIDYGIGFRQHLRGGGSSKYDNVWIKPDSQPFVSCYCNSHLIMLLWCTYLILLSHILCTPYKPILYT